MIFKFLICITFFTSSLGFAASEDISSLEKLNFKQLVTEIPNTSVKVLDKAFSKEAVGPWLTILGSTAALYVYDEEILASSQRAGRDLGIGNKDATKTVIKIQDQDILRLPTDTASSLYFLGDGWLHMSIAAGFLIKGSASAAVRPFNTGIQLVHGMMVSTIFSQALKRSFGREDPNFSTEKRGAWRPFPSFKAYNEESAKYDGMPSGHIMTATLTFTVIHLNYPEYAAWTLPIGGVWLTALGFEMVNNGVHWASDYPLGIALGYLVGKMATTMGHDDKKEKEHDKSNVVFYPVISPAESSLNMIYSF